MTLSCACVISGRSVEGRAIVPDGQIILAPAEADLQVMALGDELIEVTLDEVAFRLGGAVDPAMLNLVTSAEEGFPASDGVGTNDRVRSLEVSTVVLR